MLVWVADVPRAVGQLRTKRLELAPTLGKFLRWRNEIVRVLRRLVVAAALVGLALLQVVVVAAVVGEYVTRLGVHPTRMPDTRGTLRL